MSDDVKRYYRDRVLSAGDSSLQWQVGKTVNGVDVPLEQIELILSKIEQSLQLNAGDTVLDIGCGNGLLTSQIAKKCQRVTGVEVTQELYEMALRHSVESNLTYHNANVFEFLSNSETDVFSKVYLYEVIQHFSHHDTDELLSYLADACSSNTKIFIGGIPDISRMWSFFNTPERVAHYYDGIVQGNDPIGVWYHPNFFEYLASKHGFKFSFLEQSKNFYTSHYRYDCLLER